MLIFFFLYHEGMSQIMISGKVTGTEDKEGLPGVSVLVKGTSKGTVTDVNGTYSINVSDPEATLVFSFVGFLQEEVEVNNRTIINVTLIDDIKQLTEVVVVGYGTQKKSDLTGSVASADLEAFQESPNTNILQSLQGSLPGVQIGQVTTDLCIG